MSDIKTRLDQMPESKRGVYVRAMTGKSRAAGVKAMCQECMGWTMARALIGGCTDTGCPLYPYRPFKDDS